MITGTAGDDLLIGSQTDDVLIGLEGNDTFNGQRGNDIYDGGEGIDTGIAFPHYAMGPISFDLLTDSVFNVAPYDSKTFISIEILNTDFPSNTPYSITLKGGYYGDRLSGGAGSDLLVGRGGDDQIYGGGGNDTLDGGDGNDQLNGGNGNDRYIVGSGSDQVVDHGGIVNAAVGNDFFIDPESDTLVLAGSRADYFAPTALGDGTLVIVNRTTFELVQFTGIEFLEFADLTVAISSYGPFAITGTEGDDHYGSLFATYNGGIVYGLDGWDDIQGSAFADVIYGGDGGGLIRGGFGDDTIYGGDGGPDTIFGNEGSDIIDGGANTDYIFAGSGNDRIIASEGHDYINGGDLLNSGAHNTIIFLGNLADYNIDYAMYVPTFPPTPIDNFFFLSTSIRVTDTRPGAFNQITEFEYADRLQFADVTINVRDLDFTIVAKENDYVLSSVWSGSTVYGNNLDNTILVAEGDDNIYGGDGNDRISTFGFRYWMGNDHYDGGSGNDYVELSFNFSTAPVEFNFIAPRNVTPMGTITMARIERIVLTGAEWFNNDLAGGNQSDQLFGGSVDDIISGRGGDDVLVGLMGSDRIDGGAGNDLIYGQIEQEQGYSPRDGGDYLIGGSGEDRIFGHGGDDILEGGSGNDWLDSGTGTDHLYGGAGDDVLIAGPWIGSDLGGENIVDPGPGNDIVEAGNANVRVLLDFSTSRTGVTLDLSQPLVVAVASDQTETLSNVTSMTVTGSAQADTFVGGWGNDVMFGRAGNDILAGFVGDDKIDGGDGTDTIIGNDGADELTGGRGADRFVYFFWRESEIGASDYITDFSRSQGDVIDLSNIDANELVDGYQPFQFIGGTAFSGTAGELRFETGSDGNTHILGDVDGSGSEDFDIILVGQMALNLSEVIL